MSLSQQVEPRWTRDPARSERARSFLTRRTWIALSFLAVVAALAGVFAGMLAWLRGTPSPHFVPIFVSEYRSLWMPDNVASRRTWQDLRNGGYFTNIEASSIATEQHHLILGELDNLANKDEDEAVVVYLAAFAGKNERGEVFVMPGNARPDDSATLLLLRDILAAVARCPSRKKCLVLELSWDLVVPRLGLLGRDITSEVARELDAIDDPDLTVFSSCAPGQVGLVSEVLGQSLFGYHFEQALRGQADGYDTGGHRDGRISLFELVRFVQARVDRWAWKLFGQRQSPRLLRRGNDFELVALAHDRQLPDPTLPKSKVYPKWLSDGWALRDKWRSEQVHRIDPSLFLELEGTLVRTEQRWNVSSEAAPIEEALKLQLTRLSQRFAQAQAALPNPTPRSLARLEATGYVPTTDISKDVLDMLLRVEKETTTATKANAQDPAKKKLVDAFLAKTKDVSFEDFAIGILRAVLIDPELDWSSIRLLEELLKTRRNVPKYVETMWIQRLADVQGEPWSLAILRKMLAVVAKGEQAISHPDTMDWFEESIDEVAQVRHDAEVLFWSNGYVPEQTLQEKLDLANQHLDRILATEEVLVRARRLMDEAFVYLPAVIPYLIRHPLLESTWLNANRTASNLADLLLTPDEHHADQLGYIERQSAALEQNLQRLQLPFGDKALSTLLQNADPRTKARTARELDALLQSPFFDSTTRKKVWLAHRKLARDLVESTQALDSADLSKQQRTPLMEPASESAARQARLEESLLVGSCSIGVLRLSGLGEKELNQANAALEKKDLAQLQPALRDAWMRRLPEAILEATTLERQDRLTRLRLPLDETTSAPNESANPTVQAQILRTKSLLAWLVGRFWYEVHEGQAVKFYSSAARDYTLPGEDVSDWYVEFEGSPTINLTRKKPSANVEVTWSLQGAIPSSVKTSASVLPSVSEQLVVKPGSSSGPDRFSLGLDWRTELEGIAPPKGVLVRVDVDGRAFHQRIPFGQVPEAETVELLLGPSPSSLAPWSDSLRLRPLSAYQSYHLGLRNRTAKEQKVLVIVGAAAPQQVTLPASQTIPLTWDGTAPKAGTALPELPGPLRVSVVRVPERTLLVEKTLDIDIAHPLEYVGIDKAEFTPGNLARNQLAVRLLAKRTLNPPCVAEMVLDPTLIPGFLEVKGGNMRGIVPPDGKTQLTLTATNLQLAPNPDEVGLVPITVDDCQRAFLLRVPFERDGAAPVAAHLQREPALRLDAPALASPGKPFSLTVEVDEAPEGSTLEVSYGRGLGAGYTPEQTYKYKSARQRRVGFSLGPKGALLFQASLRDWTVSIDTKGLLGRRTLRARLLASDGHVLASASKSWTLDGEPPTPVEFDSAKVDAKHTTLSVQASSDAPLSGIAKADFFLGKPTADGKIPENTPTVPGKPTDTSKTTWSAELSLPATAKGSVDVSVRFTNGVGLTRLGTLSVNLLKASPPTTGTVKGTILEGPRPQPKLPVVLLDAKGGQVAKTTTADDGTFTFEKVKPGKYQVQSTKTASMRSGVSPVEVEAGKTATVTVNLVF